jgi:hypothetical protein
MNEIIPDFSCHFLYMHPDDTEPRHVSVLVCDMHLPRLQTGQIETFIFDVTIGDAVVPVGFIFERLQIGAWLSAVDTTRVRHLGLGGIDATAESFPDFARVRQELIDATNPPAIPSADGSDRPVA